MYKKFNPVIRESKDRELNPYWIEDKAAPLEDDYSEDSNADSVCRDNSASWPR